MPEIERINIEILKEGLPGISGGMGNHLIEGCVVCLHRSNHLSETIISIGGDIEISYSLEWNIQFTDQLDRSWKDQIYATEHGAVCIAILIALKLTDYTILERSIRTTGFDYWLGNKDDDGILFQKKARLEISGIFKGDKKSIKKRVDLKLTQTNQSDSLNIPAYISIIEFSEPCANFVMKK
jgi:hypothetical protein